MSRTTTPRTPAPTPSDGPTLVPPNAAARPGDSAADDVLPGLGALVDAAVEDLDAPRPLILPDGRVRLSFSAVDSYRTCPARFAYGYRDRIPTRPGPHLSFGTSVHAALEVFHDRMLPITPTRQELLDALYHRWERSGFAELGRDEELKWYRRAQQVLEAYFDREIDRWRPAAATEQWFEVPFGDTAVVVGSIDRVDVDDDGNISIIDYKTGRPGSVTTVRQSLQLAIYARACEHLYGRLPVEVSLYYVTSGLDLRVRVDDIDLDLADAAVADTAQAVLDQAFEPTPGKVCTWCDYRRVCDAWQGEGPDVLGAVAKEVDELRARVGKDLVRLRDLEATLVRLTSDDRASTA